MQHFRHHVRLRRKSGIYCLQLHQKEITGMKLNLHDFKFIHSYHTKKDSKESNKSKLTE